MIYLKKNSFFQIYLQLKIKISLKTFRRLFKIITFYVKCNLRLKSLIKLVTFNHFDRFYPQTLAIYPSLLRMKMPNSFNYKVLIGHLCYRRLSMRPTQEELEERNILKSKLVIIIIIITVQSSLNMTQFN